MCPINQLEKKIIMQFGRNLKGLLLRIYDIFLLFITIFTK